MKHRRYRKLIKVLRTIKKVALLGFTGFVWLILLATMCAMDSEIEEWWILVGVMVACVAWVWIFHTVNERWLETHDILRDFLDWLEDVIFREPSKKAKGGKTK